MQIWQETWAYLFPASVHLWALTCAVKVSHWQTAPCVHRRPIRDLRGPQVQRNKEQAWMNMWRSFKVTLWWNERSAVGLETTTLTIRGIWVWRVQFLTTFSAGGINKVSPRRRKKGIPPSPLWSLNGLTHWFTWHPPPMCVCAWVYVVFALYSAELSGCAALGLWD